MELQSVGVGEFRAHLHKYTQKGDDPIAITMQGETIGYFIPTGSAPQAEHFAAFKQAVEKLASILESSGVDAADILADFQTERQQSSQP